MINADAGRKHHCPCGESFSNYNALYYHVSKKETAVCSTNRTMGRPYVSLKDTQQVRRERNERYHNIKARENQELAAVRALNQKQ